MTGMIQAMNAVEAGVVEIVKPESQLRTRPSDCDAANDWLCFWCHNRVASERDRFSYDGRSEFSFKNPEGIRFDIITFSRMIGCREAGNPTLDHTWFPGHAWSYCVCGRCRTHLGWCYTGPSEFVGLILSRIVRASVVRN